MERDHQLAVVVERQLGDAGPRPREALCVELALGREREQRAFSGVSEDGPVDQAAVVAQHACLEHRSQHEVAGVSVRDDGPVGAVAFAGHE